jgi:hypothetical protein
MQNVDDLISLIRANRDREALDLLNASTGLATGHSKQKGQLHGATPLHWAAHRKALIGSGLSPRRQPEPTASRRARASGPVMP